MKNEIENIYTQIADKQLVIDSRQIVHPENTVFFAIKGKHHNGHDYVAALQRQGVRYFVVETYFAHTPLFASLSQENTHFIVVDNAIATLQTLAAFHRKQFNLPVIGITGSNGKTIIKEWLGQLLAADYQVVKSPKSYNSQIGVPLSVWQLNRKHEIAIFEAGISKPTEMQKLQQMILPDIGIFTNIGTAHDEGFASRQEKIAEKLQLFTESSLVIYCLDHQEIEENLQLWQQKHPSVMLFSWGYSPLADLQILSKTKTTRGTLLKIVFKNLQNSLEIPFADTIFIENSLHCLALLLALGFELSKAEQLLQHLKPVKMRLELKGGINDCLLIDDTYNNDLAGLTVALNFLQQHKQKPKNTVILSDMLESGNNAEELYPKIAYLLESQQIDKIIGIGSEISQYAEVFGQKEKYFFEHTHNFIESFGKQASTFSHENILIKGARNFGFELIVKQLQAKIHGTVLEINLEALLHNLNFYRSLLKPETKMMVMVKAFAYGSGSFEVAKLLEYQKVDYLAVAYTDEGIALRENGITLPIMVMNPSPEVFDKLLQYDLEPELYSFGILESFADYLMKAHRLKPMLQEIRRLKPMLQKAKIHLKLDTGMHRLGFEEQDLPKLAELLQILATQIEVVSVFTHLAGADGSEFEDFSLLQLQKFSYFADQIESSLGYAPIRHACNSAAIVRFKDLLTGAKKVEGIAASINNMVRLGIGLYGVEANGLLQEKLRPIGTLKTIISQIKQVKQGETVGYSRKGKAEKDTTIATIAIGYADGFNRKFSNGKGKVLINNQLAPIIGNVCMDMCMVDITNIAAEEGDEVIIFSKDLPISVLAEQIGTIPYEILTAVGERVKRVFLSE
jgi:alanine racemase